MPHAGSAPSPWIMRFAPRIPVASPVVGETLDVACGGGRHLRALLALGLNVVGVDRDVSGLADLRGRPGVEIIAADLENGDPWPLPPDRRFSAVIVTNYLHRPLIPVLMEILAPGGLLLYETFAAGNERFGRPRNPDFLLRPGELLAAAAAAGLTVAAYEHGTLGDPPRAAVQRLCAVRGESELPVG